MDRINIFQDENCICFIACPFEAHIVEDLGVGSQFREAAEPASTASHDSGLFKNGSGVASCSPDSALAEILPGTSNK